MFSRAAVNQETSAVLDEFPCPNCESNVTKRSIERAQQTVFDDRLHEAIQIAKTTPVLVSYVTGKTRNSKDFSNFDRSLNERVQTLKIEDWFPTDIIPDGYNTRQPIESHGLTHIHHFYTKRAIKSLSFAYKKANQLRGRKRSIALFFVNQVVLGMAKIARFVPTHFSQVNQYLSGTLYIGSQVVDVSVSYILDGKLRRLPKAFELIRTTNVTTTNSASNIVLKDNSLDYIFTDPPFGANIMYSELNLLWESWLRIKTNNITEAIENKVQGKSLLDYQELMSRCFQEYNRVLKPGRWMTVEFSNTGAAVWNGIQTALQRAGFVIANVAALDKQQGSFKAVTTPTAVKQDLVISCYKPSDDFEIKFASLSGTQGVWEFVTEHLEHLPITVKKAGNSTAVVERSPKILYDRLITFYVMRNLPVPLDAVEFQAGLRQKFDERDGMYFLKDQAAEYDEAQGIATKQGEQLRLVFDLIYSESDALLWLQERLKTRPQTYQDIQPDYRKANVANRKGELPTELGTLLEENFIQNSDNTWRVPDLNEAKDREALRNKSLLKEFGDYVTDASGGKKLKEVRVEALRAGFKNHWERKEFRKIITVAEKIPNNILLEDEQLLMYYDIAQNFV